MPYKKGEIREGRICLFDSHNISVKQIANFTNYLFTYEIATIKDKVGYFIWNWQFSNF